MGKPARKKISPKRFAEARIRGASLEEANLRSGYSPASAKRGWACASRACKEEYAKALGQQLAELETAGGKLSPEQRTAVIRGAALRNVCERADSSIGSLKLLAQDKEVNMLTADHQVGVFVLECPAHLGRRIVAPLPQCSDGSQVGSGNPADRGSGKSTWELDAERERARLIDGSKFGGI